MKKSYEQLIDVLSAALETNNFNDSCKAALIRHPILLNSFMEAFPERTDIAMKLPESHNFLTLVASSEIESFFEVLKIILGNEPFRNALLNAPGKDGWTALQWAWDAKNFPAIIELLKYKPKLDAETFIEIMESKHLEIKPQLKEKLKEQYPHLTKATVTIQALIKTYLEQKHFLTVKSSLLPLSQQGERQEREKAAQPEIPMSV